MWSKVCVWVCVFRVVVWVCVLVCVVCVCSLKLNKQRKELTTSVCVVWLVCVSVVGSLVGLVCVSLVS
jgi:hypothetical protein